MKKILTLIAVMISFLWGESQTITQEVYQQNIARLDRGYNYKKYPKIAHVAKGGQHPDITTMPGPAFGYVRFVVLNPASLHNRSFVYNGKGGIFTDPRNPDHDMLYDKSLDKIFIEGCANEVLEYIDFKISDARNENIFSGIQERLQDLEDCCREKDKVNLNLKRTYSGAAPDSWLNEGYPSANKFSGLALAPVNQNNFQQPIFVDENEREYNLLFGLIPSTKSWLVNILVDGVKWALIGYGAYQLGEAFDLWNGTNSRRPRPPNPDPGFNPGDSSVFGFSLTIGGN